MVCQTISEGKWKKNCRRKKKWIGRKKNNKKCLVLLYEELGIWRFCFPEDFLSEKDLGLEFYNIATKNDSRSQFFRLRTIVFDIITDKIQKFFAEHVSNIAVTLDKVTGKSLSEAFILTSTNPKYDKRLFIDLPIQYMKTTSSEHWENMGRTCSPHVLSL